MRLNREAVAQQIPARPVIPAKAGIQGLNPDSQHCLNLDLLDLRIVLRFFILLFLHQGHPIIKRIMVQTIYTPTPS